MGGKDQKIKVTKYYLVHIGRLIGGIDLGFGGIERIPVLL